MTVDHEGSANPYATTVSGHATSSLRLSTVEHFVKVLECPYSRSVITGGEGARQLARPAGPHATPPATMDWSTSSPLCDRGTATERVPLRGQPWRCLVKPQTASRPPGGSAGRKERPAPGGAGRSPFVSRRCVDQARAVP